MLEMTQSGRFARSRRRRLGHFTQRSLWREVQRNREGTQPRRAAVADYDSEPGGRGHYVQKLDQIDARGKVRLVGRLVPAERQLGLDRAEILPVGGLLNEEQVERTHLVCVGRF